MYELSIDVNPSSAQTPGDFDGDQDVDEDDFLIWQGSLGVDAGGDADGDGDTDGNDLLIWQSNFGSASGGAALAAGLAMDRSLIDNQLTTRVGRNQFQPADLSSKVGMASLPLENVLLPREFDQEIPVARPNAARRELKVVPAAHQERGEQRNDAHEQIFARGGNWKTLGRPSTRPLVRPVGD